MGFGGPVWHASAAALPQGKLALGRNVLRSYAREALAGVGDESQEWEEWTGYAFHLRRRLTSAEDLMVGPVVDVRGTPEGARRVERLRRILPAEYCVEE